MVTNTLYVKKHDIENITIFPKIDDNDLKNQDIIGYIIFKNITSSTNDVSKKIHSQKMKQNRKHLKNTQYFWQKEYSTLDNLDYFE